MAFRFRFQALQQQRRILLEEAQSALTAAQHRHHDILVQIERMREHLGRQWQQWEEKQNQGTSASYVLSFRDYIRFLEQQLLNLERARDGASQSVMREKAKVLEKDKAVRMLEVLEENERQNYRIAQARSGQKRVDDVAVFGTFRTRSESEEQ